MQSMIRIIDGNARQNFPSGTYLPSSLLPFMGVAVTIHRFWVLKRDTQEITQNESSMVAFGLGFGLNKFIGENLLGNCLSHTSANSTHLGTL